MNKQSIHVKAPENWVNDPNGFIYYKGNYHLFYQYFPYGPMWGTMHWGHAVSENLVDWEHKDIALFPTLQWDQNGCFSGSAVEHEGRMHLFYTGVRYEKINPENIHTCVNDQFEAAQLTISSEDGMNFDNWKGKHVIIPPIMDSKIGDRTHTRDPKVWRGKDGWYLVIGSTTDTRQGEILFYKSQDLKNWEYVNKAVKGDNSLGWMWECPDYFSVEGGEVLLLSVMGLPQGEGRETNNSICLPVKFEEDTCTMEISDAYQYLDCGGDLYAPQTTLDEEGRRTMIAWLRMPMVTDENWRGMFSSPRVVEMRNNHIYFRMHPNIAGAFTRKIQSPDQASSEGYRVSLELGEGESLNIGGYEIRRKNNRIYGDRAALLAHTIPEDAMCTLVSSTPEIQEGNHLDILVSKNIIEIYINHGEYVLTHAVYHLGDEITASCPMEMELSALDV